MIFKKYSEIENSYNAKFVKELRDQGFDDPSIEYVCENKIDGCLKNDTILDTFEFGNLTIGEIVEKKMNCSVKSFNHQTNEIVYSKIKGFSKTKSKNNWYKITLNDGQTIVITGNHRVFLPKFNCYRKVEDLTENDEVSVEK